MCCKAFMKIFLGVDPGASGAIAVLQEDGVLLAVIDMPVVELKVGKAMKRRVSPEILAHALSPYAGAVAYLEQVSAMPGQGVSSMFAFGESYGIVKGVLAALGIGTHLVTPGAWKKAMGLNAGKDGSRARAIQMWPSHVGDFKRIKDDGRAEACLIAEFGRSKNL
jgi:crossover junction endodeoxyribonuclease RuvC